MQPSSTLPTVEQLDTMHREWQKFIGSIASEAKLVNVSRLAFEGVVVKNDQSVENKIFVENNLTVSGNLTLKAESLEAAIETAKRCPILFADGIVEVRPTVPMQ